MTLRERIADWIAAAMHGAKWKQIALETQAMNDMICRNFDELCRDRDRLDETTWRYRLALEQIESMETPSANATVRRMAATAREALK